MGVDGAVVVTAAGLFLTWSAMWVGVVIWLSNRFADLEKAIDGHVTESEYAAEHNVLRKRVTAIEKWALRLNGSVKINFADVSDKDLLT